MWYFVLRLFMIFVVNTAMLQVFLLLQRRMHKGWALCTRRSEMTRINGFQPPYHPQQVAAWLLIILLPPTSYFMSVQLLQDDFLRLISSVLIAVMASVEIVLTVCLTYTDPSEASVKCSTTRAAEILPNCFCVCCRPEVRQTPPSTIAEQTIYCEYCRVLVCAYVLTHGLFLDLLEASIAEDVTNALKGLTIIASG